MLLGRDLMRPNMSAGGSCLSTLIAAPTFPRTVPRTSTLQRQSNASVADNADSSLPYHQRQLPDALVDGLRCQTVANCRQTQQNAVETDRSVHITSVESTDYDYCTITA